MRGWDWETLLLTGGECLHTHREDGGDAEGEKDLVEAEGLREAGSSLLLNHTEANATTERTAVVAVLF